MSTDEVKGTETEIIYDDNGNAGFMVGDTLYLLSEFMKTEREDSFVGVLGLTNFHALVVSLDHHGDALTYWYEGMKS